MLITLTTPHSHDIGHGEIPIIYTQVKIIGFTLAPDQKELYFHTQYGDTVNEVWAPGAADTKSTFYIRNIPEYMTDPETLIPADPAFDILMMSARAGAGDELVPSDGGFSIYTAAARNLYEWLIAEGKYVGTIV